MSKKQDKDGWWQFLELCRKTKTSQELNDLLSFYLTLSEKEAINWRVALVSELFKGELTQREIAKKLNISIAKITRGSNLLKTISGKLKTFLVKHQK